MTYYVLDSEPAHETLQSIVAYVLSGHYQSRTYPLTDVVYLKDKLKNGWGGIATYCRNTDDILHIVYTPSTTSGVFILLVPCKITWLDSHPTVRDSRLDVEKFDLTKDY